MTYAVAYVQITTYICNVIRKTISQTSKEIKVMRKISEKTLITSMVNYKCVGYLGMRGLSKKERGACIDELIERGWIDENMMITKKGDSIIKENLHLLHF